jgi:hypothetical protein
MGNNIAAHLVQFYVIISPGGVSVNGGCCGVETIWHDSAAKPIFHPWKHTAVAKVAARQIICSRAADVPKILNGPALFYFSHPEYVRVHRAAWSAKRAGVVLKFLGPLNNSRSRLSGAEFLFLTTREEISRAGFRAEFKFHA